MGDLIVKLTVKADPYFKREGYDIYTEVKITIGMAVLGGNVEVKCLNGIRNVVVPSGTSSGKKIRLPGEGVTKLPPNHTTKGDHYVIFIVDIPTKLTDRQKEIFEELKKIEEGKEVK